MISAVILVQSLVQQQWLCRFSWDYIFDWTLKKAQQVAGLRSVYGTTSKLIHYSSKLQEADVSQDAHGGANSGHLEGSLKNVECV